MKDSHLVPGTLEASQQSQDLGITPAAPAPIPAAAARTRAHPIHFVTRDSRMHEGEMYRLVQFGDSWEYESRALAAAIAAYHLNPPEATAARTPPSPRRDPPAALGCRSAASRRTTRRPPQAASVA